MHKTRLILTMGLFSCKSLDDNSKPLKTIVLDRFIDNSNNWVDSAYYNPPFLKRIENEMLRLESYSDEMGVISSTRFKLDDSKDFIIEAKVKIQSDYEDNYMTLDFGIKKQNDAMRNVSGLDISTTYGHVNYYFGYNDSKEVLITKWNKGREKYFYRGYCNWIDIDGFNTLKISKIGQVISFYINDKLIHSQKFKGLPGDGFGFSTAPNGKLWVDYIKIDN